MKTTLTQDNKLDQNPRRKENGSSTDNPSARNVKLQTSFPPIHFSLSTPTHSVDRSRKEHVSGSNMSRDARGQKINLPHVEKPAEKIPKAAKQVAVSDRSKLTLDLGRNLRPHSSTPLLPLDGTKDSKSEKQTWLDVSPSKLSPERLSPETANVLECSTCKKERRIRNDYDKIIVQSKQDKEVLQQRINELEAEVAKCKDEGSNKQQETQDSESSRICHAEQQTEDGNLHCSVETSENKLVYEMNASEMSRLEEENIRKQEKIDSLLTEIEDFKAQLVKIQENGKADAQKMKSKNSKLVTDLEELQSQFEKTQEKEKRHILALEQEKEIILLQLETTKSELEKLKKRRALTLSELRKEKDTCLAEIEELKAGTEKMRLENESLLDRIHTFEQELAKRTLCPGLPSHTYAIPPSTEMLVISHQVSQPTAYPIATGLRNGCCTGHGGVMQDFSVSKCVATQNPLDEDTIRFKDMYKQLKRERNLLLDVMEIMYTRRWFLEEAVPHVKRALKKCGVFPEDVD
ncbi:polyamine-modulated factor 1-binding protein 1-like isoform X2 [Ambystoma mexicanum]|uniref:polyamine-modulated factor 1-binding protein 1-like isoform X2 n=1 Tax=Ambystoma mexicanum TaxID=8296 RepID=UPI0037E84EC5